MADERTLQLSLADPEPEPGLASPPWAVEAAADALMDDLFSDIDRILDGGSHLPTAIAELRTSPAVPTVLTPPPTAPGAAPASPASPTPPGSATPKPRPAASKSAAQRRWNWRQHTDQIFFACACLALVGVTTSLALQQRLPWQRQLPGASPDLGTARPLTGEDTSFIGYMLRSLQAIERQGSPELAQAGSSESPVASQLPVAPNSGSQTIERVYIPVYPPVAPGAAATVVPPAGRPSLASPPAPAASPVPAAPTSPTATAPSPREAPAAARSPLPANGFQAALPQLSPLPTLPALPTLEASPEERTEGRTETTGTYKLVGLLESGDRSAALFEINGTTQRVSVDEEIGGTGWRLVAAANQVAIIERRGETRSLYVGQRF